MAPNVSFTIAAALLTTALAAAGCKPKAAAPLFVCQKDCALPTPAGPAPFAINAPSDLLRLVSGAEHKYVVAENGALLVAAQPKSVPGNAFHHPVLAGGRPIRTGGAITARHDGRELGEVTVTQETYSYCATFESLAAAEAALVAAGVAKGALRRADRSPKCAPRSP